ncbi:MAG: amylo-alpha-1,6-glucosidase [Verrucomicrobiota bacterium]
MMSPGPGSCVQRFVGDQVTFELRDRAGRSPAAGWRALLRTNLGRAEMLRREILRAHTRGPALAGASWRDLPLQPGPNGWSIQLPLVEPGYFRAKAFLLDPQGWQHWPEGGDVGICVHPDAYRTANTIYCAFPRLLGPGRAARSTSSDGAEAQLQALEKQGYAVIPPSGKLRDVTAIVPHIVGTLGCRILHLLPVNPTPSTYARFGRFGSPYAALDLAAIDPALVVFDKRTTGQDQFRELTEAMHRAGGRVFLDMVINHTGWGSTLQENHPEQFVRNPDGTFASPGAWGVVWEDLVELRHDDVALWDQLAEAFLTWCRRGVDGFRCDAGYQVPAPAWQYIVARVQEEYPETIFLLEGLGGAWETTRTLLTEGGMQWAYSELFQNFSPQQVAGYLDHSLRQAGQTGLLVHYSETHDNDRLARRGREWSLLRNRLSALASSSGAFGFTSGVEWLAAEKIDVHRCTGLSWNNDSNIVPELARLNRVLAGNPCFFDGAQCRRLSSDASPVYALLRRSAEGADTLLVLVNTDAEHEQGLILDKAALRDAGLDRAPSEWIDLLGQPAPSTRVVDGLKTEIRLQPGAACCLSGRAQPAGLAGDDYRRARARAAWGLQALNRVLPVDQAGFDDWKKLAEIVDAGPAKFLAAAIRLKNSGVAGPLSDRLRKCLDEEIYPQVITWTPADRRRVTAVPPGHWLLIEDDFPFRAMLQRSAPGFGRQVESVLAGKRHIAVFGPDNEPGAAALLLERYAPEDGCLEAAVRFLQSDPAGALPRGFSGGRGDERALLTNGRGGMARLCVDLGRITSKYDCALGANLHPQFPVDRHVFAKRIRAWVNADGFISPLNRENLAAFRAGPPAAWDFVANAGDGRTVEISLRAAMIPGRNTVVLRFRRPAADQAAGIQLPVEAEVRLTVRVDMEDRNFHCETKRNAGAEAHFTSNTRELRSCLPDGRAAAGFEFTPAADRHFRAYTTDGQYRPQPEWCENIPHPVEQSRGQPGSGDAYSPGWFELPLPKGGEAVLILTAEESDPAPEACLPESPGAPQAGDAFEAHWRQAVDAFVVRRDSGKTVVAGYPWFLDWGRDSLICARGLLAAGRVEETREILLTFARFEQGGTLPNMIHGNDASNRDTSDAPLWFGVVCEDLAALGGEAEFLNTRVDPAGRTVRDILRSIAENYVRGTANGIRVDPDSALVWSPAHFTWMDTNFPAGTAREGYPVEIQALWVRLLRQLGRIDAPAAAARWKALAKQALESIERFFWIEDRGFYGDVLLAGPGVPAAKAVCSDALRSNALFLASLGIVQGARARRCVAAARQHLVIPGGLRSLAPLPVSVPLPVQGPNGLLNNPVEPYWGRYEGDEDTRRKPAYHNGTAWTWTFPVFCEALAAAWEASPEAVAAARAYLGSAAQWLERGCLGQIPEVLDGDAPHEPRGCDAQAWGATETLRVWKKLGAG